MNRPATVSPCTLPVRRLLAALLCAAGLAGVQARSTYDGITVVSMQRASGSGTTLNISEAGAVEKLMDEINRQRSGSWEVHRGEPTRCAVRLTFVAGSRRVARLWLDGDRLVEPSGIADDKGYGRTLGSGDLRQTRRYAAQVSGC
jgi:hypothetical protein